MSAELPATVPGPVPPDDRAAWYAPAVRAQYHVGAGVVATVTETDAGYRYRTREPMLSRRERDACDRVEASTDEESRARPRTREEAIERMAAGLPSEGVEGHPSEGVEGHPSEGVGGRPSEEVASLSPEWRSAAGEFRSPAARRRVGYHLNGSLRGLGELTPLALDDRIRIADTSGDRLAVHTRDFAPAVTDLDTDTPHLDRFLSERLTDTTVEFEGFAVPVVVYRRHVLGADTFHTRYAVAEPSRRDHDEEHLQAVRNRLLEAPPDAVRTDRSAAVIERARTLLARRLRRPDLASIRRRLRRALDRLPSCIRPRQSTRLPAARSNRLDDLVYHVARDLVGDGPLSIPMRDPRIRAIEVAGIGDGVTVVPQPGAAIEETRMPTDLSIPDPDAFRRLARSLAAEGGVELSSDRPVATVEIERPVGDRGAGSAAAGNRTRTLECSISLPAAAGTDAHISITAERPTPPSPIELVDRGVLGPDLVAAIWTVLAEAGTVVFVGSARAEPVAALAAHAPFVPPDARPVSLPGTRRAVAVPHETGVTIGRDALPQERPAVVGDRAGLDPGMVLLAGIEAPESMRRFGSALAAGRGALAAAKTADRGFFVDAAAAAGLSSRALDAIDLLVELPDRGAAEPASGWIPAGESPAVDAAAIDPPSTGQESRQVAVEWSQVFGPARSSDASGDPPGLERLAAGDDFDRAALERRRQYVEYLHAEAMTDRAALLGFLGDIRTDEAATVERIQRSTSR